MDFSVTVALRLPQELKNQVYQHFLAIWSPQQHTAAPNGPRGDPSVPSTSANAINLMDGRLSDARALIWTYFVPTLKVVPATFVDRPWRHLSTNYSPMSLLLTSKEVMDEVSMKMYEQKQFELHLNHKTIKFLNTESPHLLPRDELNDREKDRFSSEQLFGFSRIQHLKLVVETMFPRSGDPCKQDKGRYDLALYSTVQGLVTLLTSDDLKHDQRGLSTLEIVFTSTYRAANAGTASAPNARRPQFEHSSTFNLAHDFVLRPLSKLRWVDNVTVTFPWFCSNSAHPDCKLLRDWSSDFKRTIKIQDPDVKDKRRVDFDQFIVGTISIDMFREWDNWTIMEAYHKKFGPEGGDGDKDGDTAGCGTDMDWSYENDEDM